MKRIYTILTGLFIMAGSTWAQGFNINVEISGIKDTSVILGYYFNNKMLVTDTIQVNSKGQGTFTGEKPLAQGIYLIYLPDKTYFDFLLTNNQNLTIKTKAPDYLKNLVISGSDESQKFLMNQKFMADKQAMAQKIATKLEKAKAKPDSVAIYQKQIADIGNEVKQFWTKTIHDNPNTFLATFLKAVQEVEIPEIDVPANITNRDSVMQARKYYYFKNHYFDNIDLTDDRMLRTPFFMSKVENYFTKTIVQAPDTIAAEAIKMIDKCMSNEEMYKFMLQYLFNMGAESIRQNDRQTKPHKPMHVGAARPCRCRRCGQQHYVHHRCLRLDPLGAQHREIVPDRVRDRRNQAAAKVRNDPNHAAVVKPKV